MPCVGVLPANGALLSHGADSWDNGATSQQNGLKVRVLQVPPPSQSPLALIPLNHPRHVYKRNFAARCTGNSGFEEITFEASKLTGAAA